MSPGKFIYKYFFKPTLPLRHNYKHFGLKNWKNMWLGERSMKKTARKLPAITLVSDNDTLIISFLTGEKYWYQTVFCIQSLINQAGNNFSIHIYSDGTLNHATESYLKSYCAQIVIITEEQILKELNAIIPVDKYPSLNFLRTWHPFFKRMIDIHCKLKWTIHLDSDMLFFKYPTDLLKYANEGTAFYMEEQFGLSYFSDDRDVLLNKLYIPTIESVNGGIIAYDGSAIDYDDLEKKVKLLLENYTHRGEGAMEQTIMSYILSCQNAVALNKTDYKIYYDKTITGTNETLRHYIFKAKLPYFYTEWKTIIP